MKINVDLIIILFDIIIIFQLYKSKLNKIFKIIFIIFLIFLLLPHIGIILYNIGYQIDEDSFIHNLLIFSGNLLTYYK